MAEVKLNRTIVNTFKVLDVIANSSSPIGVSKISEDSTLPKTTVFRITETLAALNLISENTSQEYKLGKGFLKYVDQTKSQNDLVNIAKPFLVEFASKTKETINLGILYNQEVIYLTSIKGERFTLQVDLLPIAPLYCSSLGKIFLSTFSDKEFDDYVKKAEFKRNTVNTIVDPDELKNEIIKVRSEQLAYDREEAEYGLTCIANPIKKGSKVIAAISVSGPTSRLRARGMDKLVSQLKNTANKINQAISKSTF